MSITRRSLAETYEAQDLIIQAAQDAKREATKAYREQLDGAGMDKDAIKSEVEGFKLAYRRKVAVEKKGSDEVEHRDAIADEIYLEITSPAPRATRVATTVPDGFDPETGEEITEPQPAPQAESDLTDPEPSGQVATHPEAKASEDGGATAQAIEGPADSVAGDASRASDGAGSVAPIQPEPEGALSEVALPTTDEDTGLSGQGSASGTRSAGGDGSSPSQAPVKATGKPAEASVSAAPLYAAPGVVVMETCPPEGALAHPYAACWPVRRVALCPRQSRVSRPMRQNGSSSAAHNRDRGGGKRQC